MLGCNRIFEIDANNDRRARLKNDTWVHILAHDDTVLQTIKLHTSCSQPIRNGDQFGGLVLETLTPQ